MVHGYMMETRVCANCGRLVGADQPCPCSTMSETERLHDELYREASALSADLFADGREPVEGDQAYYSLRRLRAVLRELRAR